MTRSTLGLWSTIAVLSALTLFQQERSISLQYIETVQLGRHLGVLQGVAANPWPYRLLSEILVHPLLGAMESMGAPHPIATAFLLFRLVQNVVVFWLVSIYYRRLGFSVSTAVVGLAMLAWLMFTTNFNSDLSLNTYTDIIFYALAALAIVLRREFWILPITLFAVVNRETSGLIPLMLIVHTWMVDRGDTVRLRRNLMIGGASLAGFALLFIELRLVIGHAHDVDWSYWSRITPGLPMLWWNLTDPDNVRLTWSTIGVLPFLVVARMREVPITIRAFLIAIVPVFVLAHFPFVKINETRYFIMPMALIFIPGALMLVARDPVVPRMEP